MRELIYFLCSNSETNERQREGCCGTEIIVPFDVHSSENEFQTRQYEPHFDHEEHAKGVKHPTPGAVRRSDEIDVVESLKFLRNNHLLDTRGHE